MQPPADPPTSMQDSVVGGNLHTGNVIHNHYHTPQQVQQPEPRPTSQYQQQQPQVVMQQPQYAQYQQPVRHMYSTAPKDMLVAYALWFFLGFFGAHRFYLNHIGVGIVYLLTFGLFGFGWLLDLFLIPGLVYRSNMRQVR